MNMSPKLTEVSLEPNQEPQIVANKDPEPQTQNPRRFKTPKEIEDLFTIGYQKDPFPKRIIDMITNNVRKSKEITLADCENRAGRLYYRKKKYV
jgi:hypothetical protein